MFNIKKIETELIKLHPISKSDMQFIYELRTKRNKNQLKKISDNIEHQYAYFDKYNLEFKKGNEIYYKIESLKNKKLSGVVRIFNINDKKNLNWSSFITTEDCLPYIGIEVCFTIYRLTFDILKRKSRPEL